MCAPSLSTMQPALFICYQPTDCKHLQPDETETEVSENKDKATCALAQLSPMFSHSLEISHVSKHGHTYMGMAYASNTLPSSYQEHCFAYKFRNLSNEEEEHKACGASIRVLHDSSSLSCSMQWCSDRTHRYNSDISGMDKVNPTPLQTSCTSLGRACHCGVLQLPLATGG